jgi:hypothetical protein
MIQNHTEKQPAEGAQASNVADNHIMTFISQNWFKLAIVVVLLIAAVSIAPLFGQQKPQQDNSLALQNQCAERAATFYKQNGYADGTQGYANVYTNHWNGKLSKCFIQINTTSLNDDFLTIDVFDAMEGKHYAMYMGHNSCDPVMFDPKKCQLDAGHIWLDGNDMRTPADYTIGFQGIAVGPGVGDENTLKQFLTQIQPFMSD